jgi:hypothetical protein
MHGEVDAVPHGLDVRAMVKEHLDTGDGKRSHDPGQPRAIV